MPERAATGRMGEQTRRSRACRRSAATTAGVPCRADPSWARRASPGLEALRPGRRGHLPQNPVSRRRRADSRRRLHAAPGARLPVAACCLFLDSGRHGSAERPLNRARRVVPFQRVLGDQSRRGWPTCWDATDAPAGLFAFPSFAPPSAWRILRDALFLVHPRRRLRRTVISPADAGTC